jgi:DNA-binding CsgD family transcriptional regulator
LIAIGRELGLKPAIIQDFAATDLLMADETRTMAEVLGWEACYIDDWRAHKLYLVDPLARACRIAVKPFVWDARAVTDMVADLDPGGKRRWNLTPERGVVGGICVPVHLPLSRVGSVGWVSFDPSIDLEAIASRYSNELRMLGMVSMDRVHEARADRTIGVCDTPLTEREIECLTWVALGKTDIEIGMILNRSPATARFHIDKAAEKLGAGNRTRAVALAVQMGIISAFAHR